MPIKTQQIPKIDTQATAGLAGTPGSLAYMAAEIDNHFMSPQQLYGFTANTMARKALTPIVVTGGNGVFGTELILHNGSVIEAGSATKYFDCNQMYVVAVGTVNLVTILEFFTFDTGTPKAAAAVAATNKITDGTNTVADNDKVFFATIASNTGIDVNTVYYVVNRAAGDFEVSLTRGGAAVDITGADGAVTYTSLGASDANGYATTLQPLATEAMVSAATLNSDSFVTPMQMERHTCNKRMSCRAIAAGGTNAISFFLGLHTYPS